MIINQLDSITFRLREKHDFTWLKRYGTAFWAVDETGSGCVCIGMQDADRKLFCKIAGVNTLEADVTPAESVALLKNAVHLYETLAHPHLIQLVEAYEYSQFYVAVFEWAEGECLFDHWNFEAYQQNPALQSPKDRFKALPASLKLQAVETLFSFLQHVHQQGYVAVDFYDGSLMYDFATNTTTICDIDLFRKGPVINDAGADWFGTKRLKALEEYALGSPIDEQTNVFTLGALIFEFFGTYSDEDIRQRYEHSRFLPCALASWQLNQASYQVAAKAVSPEKADRYPTIAAFWQDWKRVQQPH